MMKFWISILACLWVAVDGRAQEPGRSGEIVAADRAAALVAAKGGIGDIDRWIASRVGGYRERFDVAIESIGGRRPARIVASSSFRVESKELDLDLERGVEFIADSARGVGKWSASGNIVFVGYGIDAPEIDWDDFKNADLSGKVCLVLPGVPEKETPLDRLATREHVRPSAKVGRLFARGAAAVVFVHKPVVAAAANAEWTAIVCDHLRRRIGLPDPSAPAVEAFMPWDVARVMCSGSGENMANLELRARERNFRPVPLDVTATLAVEVAEETMPAAPERIVVDFLPRAEAAVKNAGGYLVAAPRRRSSLSEIPPASSATNDDPESAADFLAVAFSTVDRLIATTQASHRIRMVFFDDASVRRNGESETLPLWQSGDSSRPPRRAVVFGRPIPGTADFAAFPGALAARVDAVTMKAAESPLASPTATTGAAAVPLGVSGLIDAPILGIEAFRSAVPASAADLGTLSRRAALSAEILTGP